MSDRYFVDTNIVMHGDDTAAGENWIAKFIWRIADEVAEQSVHPQKNAATSD